MSEVVCGVIGARGYLGRQLNSYIAQRGLAIRIVPFDRISQRFETVGNNPKSFDILLNLGSPNEIVSRGPAVASKKAIEEWWKNFKAAVNLARPKRCLHVSTFHIFGSVEGIVDEQSPLLGGNSYGDTHLECLSRVTGWLSVQGLPCTILVPTNIYGSVDIALMPRTDLILNLAIERCLNEKPVVLTSDGLGLRDFLWIEDALYAFSRFIEGDGLATNQTILVSSGITIPVADALKSIFHSLGKGRFEDWCKFGNINDVSSKFSVSSKKLEKLIDGWHPKSVETAGQCLKSIFKEYGKYAQSKN
ncbi:MAG: NAD-dependent epimerase/dehydratase family protein [Nitrospirae bacterium]|nr:NAD-dependent epimerase/dehydratase family protein [Nitrospirota bacterium]